VTSVAAGRPAPLDVVRWDLLTLARVALEEDEQARGRLLAETGLHKDLVEVPVEAVAAMAADLIGRMLQVTADVTGASPEAVCAWLMQTRRGVTP
jgi:hypothetical protein